MQISCSRTRPVPASVIPLKTRLVTVEGARVRASRTVRRRATEVRRTFWTLTPMRFVVFRRTFSVTLVLAPAGSVVRRTFLVVGVVRATPEVWRARRTFSLVATGFVVRRTLRALTPMCFVAIRRTFTVAAVVSVRRTLRSVAVATSGTTTVVAFRRTLAGSTAVVAASA